MMEQLGDIPTGLKWAGGAIGVIAGGFLFLRQFLSGASVDRTANSANAETIIRLSAQVVVERDRADVLMREREAMVGELGELRAEVRMLRDQVSSLTNLVESMRGYQQ